MLAYAPAARADEPPAHVHGGGDASDAGANVPEHQKRLLDPRAPKPTGKAIDLQVGSGTAKAYVARPKGKVPGPILVLHQYWGLHDWGKHHAAQLAKGS